MKKIFLGFLLSVASIIVHSAPPETLDYQGYLADSSGVPLSGSQKITVRLYKLATGGSDLWNQTTSVRLVNGRFSLILDGSRTNPFPSQAFDQQLYVGISVASDPEMTPRQPLTSVPSAFEALNSDTVDGLNANDIITAASDEVRTPISSLPFTISQSGSYYVTQNLDGSTGGIDITTDSVTLDLMGFTITGSGVADDGINLTGYSGVTIRNGKITGFGHAGIIANDLASRNNVVEDIQVIGNGTGATTAPGKSGIYIRSQSSRIENCVAIGNQDWGLYLGANGIVRGSIAEDNRLYGIQTLDGAIVSHNTVIANGWHGISTGSGSSISYNTARDNVINGIQSVASTISHNSVEGNLRNGIEASSGSTLINNTAYSNQQWGINASASNVVGNTVSFNNQSELDGVGGLRINSYSLVKNNSVYANRHTGILIAGFENILRENHVSKTIDLGSDGICYRFDSADNAAIGNTAADCPRLFNGSLPPASRFIDNIAW